MSWDLISIGPMIGGGVLLAIGFVCIFLKPGFSTALAVLLAFGALLFAVPIFADFRFKGGTFEVSARVATRQAFANQGAEIKGILTDLKTEIDHVDQGIIALAKTSDVALPSRATNTNNKIKSTVVIVYSDSEKRKSRSRSSATCYRKATLPIPSIPISPSCRPQRKDLRGQSDLSTRRQRAPSPTPLKRRFRRTPHGSRNFRMISAVLWRLT